MNNSDTHSRHRANVLVLLLLCWAYFSFNLVFRWLRWSLLFGHAKDGWPEPTLLTTLYQVFMACLPVALWTWALYAVAVRFPRLFNRVVIALLVFVAVVAAELDMNWFLMSKTHLTVDDAVVFLTGSPDDFGMDNSEILRFVKVIARHAAVIGILLAVAALLGKLFFKYNVLRRTTLTWKSAGILLAGLAIADGAFVGYCARHNTGQYAPSQWGFAAYANPARLPLLDGLWKGIFRQHPDLRRANDVLLAEAAPAGAETLAQRSEAPSSKPLNVVVVAVESFNARLAAQTDMPFWKELGGRSLQPTRHYSTGNCTHYGLLGLLYGTPPFFYDGALGQDRSPFLDLLARRGYQTRRISTPLTNFRSLGNYFNFSEGEFEDRDEWNLIPVVRSTLAQSGPHFLFLFYNKTHYSYRHGPQYKRYQPEVPEDYHFQTWDAARHATEISNRYKNCLLEFDDWLRTLVKELDMQRTILVVTGDHGEEFFESGRLGHCSYLNDAQTQVPCLIAIPGRQAETFTDVTSHADIMPTIMDALGWRVEVPCYGQSIVNGRGPRCAVVAQSNQHHRPTVWAVVSGDRKTIVEGPNRLKIIALFDRQERKLQFSADPASWTANFAHVQRFQRALLARVLPGMAVEDERLALRQKPAPQP
jgi:glucan phosphoethanolaminetransferase (alkaline phosphatase superfamily)